LTTAVTTVDTWLRRERRMEWVRPLGGCVAFPRIRHDAGVDIAAFYRALAEEHKTCVGPGHWFEMEDRYMRIGFGWPRPDELSGGLAAISASLDAARM
jgi:aspartate/methionine/tyrosine aminotransferase